jgi:hypothetical protein
MNAFFAFETPALQWCLEGVEIAVVRGTKQTM